MFSRVTAGIPAEIPVCRKAYELITHHLGNAGMGRWGGAELVLRRMERHPQELEGRPGYWIDARVAELLCAIQEEGVRAKKVLLALECCRGECGECSWNAEGGITSQRPANARTTRPHGSGWLQIRRAGVLRWFSALRSRRTPRGDDRIEPRGA